jgi:hypothetical protein
MTAWQIPERNEEIMGKNLEMVAFPLPRLTTGGHTLFVIVWTQVIFGPQEGHDVVGVGRLWDIGATDSFLRAQVTGRVW